MKRTNLYIFSCLVILLFLCSCTQQGTNIAEKKAGVSKTDQGEITILWADWAPANFLETLSKDFTAETGIKVNVIKEPWSNFQTVFFDEMAKKGESYDLVVGDSQWLGKGVTGAHYVELTSWIKEKGIAQTMTPASMVGYCEYPKESGRYYAIPLEGDANGFAYRKDLFEDPIEKEAFKNKYGYELKVPEKWSQLKDIAEFFTRPEEGLYGLSMWSEKYYDAMTMNFERILWAYGGDIGHSQTYSVKGILNSDEGIEALKFRKDLQKFNPPNWSNSYFTEANNAFSEGKVAITENFFAFFPDLIDKTKNPYSEVTGFFANPEGPKGRFASLGGQGLSVIGYSKKKDLTFKYLEWFAREDVQEKWAELGGYTCNVNVLNSQKFLSATPYNPAFKESMGMIKDFWSVPEYAELLAVSQKYLNLYVTTDEITAEHALSSIADEWESIFENGGYYKE